MAVYESRQDIPNVITPSDVNETTLNLRGETPEESGATRGLPQLPLGRKYLPQPLPKTPEDDLALRHESYKIMALAEYHKDMLNIGDPKLIDPNEYAFLSGIAQTDYTMKSAKINSWQQNLRDKFKIISEADNLTDDEKRMISNKIMAKADDPIHIPTMQEVAPETGVTAVERGLGQFMSNLNTNQYFSKEEALYGTGKVPGLITLLGPDAETRFPKVSQLINQVFAPPVEKEITPKEQIMEFKRLGGMQTKEGRDFASILAGEQVAQAGGKITPSIKEVRKQEVESILKPTTQEEYDKIPSGSMVQDTDGTIFRKK